MSKRSMLVWRCRRGMKELDLLMMGYLEQEYDKATAEDQAVFESLLEMQDPDLLALLTGGAVSEDIAVRRVVEKIRGTINS